MRPILRTVLITAVFALFSLVSSGQPPVVNPPDDDRSPRMKRSQVEELLKADYAKSLEDAAQLLKICEDLKIELEKTDRHVLSLSVLKKTEEIEKLAKRIRNRMKRF
jgi:hypothetical protein